MRKTLLIISLGMSMAYADSDERSWTEKAMDIGRTITYIVHDHYDGLIKGKDYWYDQGHGECYDEGIDDGCSKGYEKDYDNCYKRLQQRNIDAGCFGMQ